MEKNPENEILNEQRKARKDFLELKKMQYGEISPEPKPSEIAIVPKTFKEKLQNLMFHYGKIGIVCFLIFCFFAFLVVQCINKPKYDLQLIYYTYSPVLEDSISNMNEYFEGIAKDLNGDGEININVVNCSYSSDKSARSYVSAQETKLQAYISSEANTLLFITDEKSTERLNELFGDMFYEGELTTLPESFYKAAMIDSINTLPEDLKISCRRVSDTMIEKDKNIKKFLKESKRILKEIEKQ